MQEFTTNKELIPESTRNNSITTLGSCEIAATIGNEKFQQPKYEIAIIFCMKYEIAITIRMHLKDSLEFKKQLYSFLQLSEGHRSTQKL